MSGTGAVRTRRSRRHDTSSAPWGVFVWGLGYVVVGIVLAALAAWPIHESPRVFLIAAVAGGLGIAIAVAARLLRWGVLTASFVAIAVYLLIAVPLAVPSGLRSVPAVASGLRDAVFGVVLGWKQLLTLDLPLGEYQAVLVPLLVVMLFGSFAAAMLVGRNETRATVAVPVVALMTVFGIAFGTSRASAALAVAGVEFPAPREWLIGVALFAASVVWTVGRARMMRTRALRAVAAHTVSTAGAPLWTTVRRHVLSGALVAVALVAGIAVSPVAAGMVDRSVLRDDVDPMIVVREQTNPLSAYRSWFLTSRLDETVISLDGDTSAVERIRFVTLDAYDGEDFHVADDTAFSRLPRSAAPGADTVGLQVTVGDGYRGVWVPIAAGLAEAPDFSGARADALADGFHVSADDATAITVASTDDGEGLLPGDAYRIVVAPETASDGLSGTTGGAATIEADAHPALAEWAAMQDVPRTGDGFRDLVERLRERGYLSHALLDDDAASGWIEALKEQGGYSFASGYSGHSAARIDELFQSLIDQEVRAGSDAPADQLIAAVGDDEQFAVAAALLARYWGLESRIVLGVRTAAADEVPGIPACDEVCTGASMSAWVEVRATGGEWTAVDVTPQFESLPTRMTEGEQLPEHPTTPDLQRDDVLDPPEAQTDTQDDPTPAVDDGNAFWGVLLPILRIVGVSVLALLLLVLPLLVLLMGKVIRVRTRRRADEPEVRLVAAWEELVDLYADHRLVMDVDGTRAERALSSGRERAEELAVLADAAVFSEHPPDAATADIAWALVDAERDELRAEQKWSSRIVRRLSPRSFLQRIRPVLATSAVAKWKIGTLAVAGADRQDQKGAGA